MTEDIKILWLDIETTGLNPNEDEILEIAYFATDGQGALISPERSYLLRVNSIDPTSYATKMHLKSGLLADLVSAQVKGFITVHDSFDGISVPLELVGIMLSQYVEKYDLKGAMLGGFSVHFDNAFLKAKGIRPMLSHRIIDVTSITYLMEQAGHKVRSTEPVAHRALDDCKAALAQYMRCLDAAAGKVGGR